MHLVGIIIRIYHNARSPERQILHGCKWHLFVLSVELVCHLSGSLKNGMATTFTVHPCTPVLNISAFKDVGKRNFNFKALSQNCENRLRRVCPSIRAHGTTRLPPHECSWNLYLSIFRKSFEKSQVSLKSDENNRYFIWRPIYVFIISGSFLLSIEMFQTKAVDEIQTRILCSIKFFSPKSWRLCDNVEMYSRADHRR